MEVRELGTCGPRISVVGYGAYEAGGAEWGLNPSEQRVIESMCAGFDAGMNWIDTAEVYGAGVSEELVGKAIAGRRDETLIFTKVAPDEEGTGLRPEEVRRAIRASLRRLRTDYVDLYQLHWPDPRIPLEDTWGTMAELVEEGLARYIGVSNFDRPLVERCLAVRQVDSVQNELSLLHVRDRDSFLPWLESRGIGYLAYSPLACGLLTGTITKETVFSDADWRSGGVQDTPYEELFAPERFEKHLELVTRLRPISERLGVPLAAVALRWVLEQRGVTAVISGSRDPAHMRENARAGDLRLGGEILTQIEAALASS